MPQHTLGLPEVDLVYDVHGPLPTTDGRPPLVMIGQPMDASGFQAQVKLFEDRTVVTYDPRGLGRSKRKDGGVTNEPETQAEDIHAKYHNGVLELSIPLPASMQPKKVNIAVEGQTSGQKQLGTTK